MMNTSGRLRRVLTGIAAVTTSALACAGLLVPSANAGPAPHLLINEVYGGGGNSGATLTHDFVELVNPTSETISLDGYAVEYYGATGSLGNSCKLSGSIAPAVTSSSSRPREPVVPRHCPPRMPPAVPT